MRGPFRADVASHYYAQAKKYSDYMLDIQNRCSNRDFIQKNLQRDANTLDLHLLKVVAAVKACKGFLDERYEALQQLKLQGSKRFVITIITGWGKHTNSGKGKLKPAIKKFLSNNGYKFSDVEYNPGIISVFMHAT